MKAMQLLLQFFSSLLILKIKVLPLHENLLALLEPTLIYADTMVKVAAEAKLFGAFSSDPHRLLYFLIEIGDRFPLDARDKFRTNSDLANLCIYFSQSVALALSK
jgi:hypothetical protein